MAVQEAEVGAGITKGEAKEMDYLEAHKNTKTAPPSVLKIAAPVATYFISVVIMGLSIASFIGAFNQEENALKPIWSVLFVSRTFVHPYIEGFPRFYSGNSTTLMQGRIFVVTFPVKAACPTFPPPVEAVCPELCEFVAKKDAYVSAIGEAFGMPAAYVTLVQPQTCQDKVDKVVMQVAVYDVEPVYKDLKLQTSKESEELQKMAPDGITDGDTKDRIGNYLLRKFLVPVSGVRVSLLMDDVNGQPVMNPVAGAPVSFYRVLMSDRLSTFINCFFQAFQSPWQEAYCQYLDTGMFLVVIAVVFIALIFVATLLFAICRHAREIASIMPVAFVGNGAKWPRERHVPLPPSVRRYSCHECGGREPTELYTPHKQLCIFFMLMATSFLGIACGIFAISGTQQFSVSVMHASDAVVSVATTAPKLQNDLLRQVKELQKEAADNLTALNYVFDRVTSFVREDARLFRSRLVNMRNEVVRVSNFVEGCQRRFEDRNGSLIDTTLKSWCDVSNETVGRSRNACLRKPTNISNSSSSPYTYEHVVPQAGGTYAMSFTLRGQKYENPTCLGQGDRPLGVCACCEVCVDVLESIDGQLQWIDDASLVMERKLQKYWRREQINDDIERAVAPLYRDSLSTRESGSSWSTNPVSLFHTYALLLVNVTSNFRQLEADTRTIRTLLNHGGWGCGVFTLICIPLSSILGIPVFANLALAVCFFALEVVWAWWAFLGLFVVPFNDFCDVLFPDITPVGALSPGEVYLPLVMGLQGVPRRRPETDLLFYTGFMEPGSSYVAVPPRAPATPEASVKNAQPVPSSIPQVVPLHGDERARWLEGRPNISRSEAVNFRKLFDACVLEPTSVMWEAMSYPKARIRQSFANWSTYDRISKQELDYYLSFAVRLAPLKEQFARVIATGDKNLNPQDGPLWRSLGLNTTCMEQEDWSCGLSSSHAAYYSILNEELLPTLRLSVSLFLTTDVQEVERAANTLLASFGDTNAASGFIIRDTVDKLVAMGTCAPFSVAYAGIRDPLCNAARPSLDAVFIATFVCAITLLPLCPLGLQALKHARQRLRDAEHPFLNILVMLRFKRFRLTQYQRELELAEVLKVYIGEDAVARMAGGDDNRHRQQGQGLGGLDAGILTVNEVLAVTNTQKQAVRGEGDLVYYKLPEGVVKEVHVKYGTGVDGWGHESNKANVPQGEMEPPLFSQKPSDYDLFRDGHFKRPSETQGTYNPLHVPKLNRQGLYDGSDQRVLEYVEATGRLRWVSECDMRGAEPVTKEASLLKLHANLIKINKNKTNELDMSTVTQFFQLIDEDGSGEITVDELRIALEEMGLLASTAEIATLIRTYDSTNAGVLDLSDFRLMCLAAWDTGMRAGAQRDKQEQEKSKRGKPAESVLQKAGKLHPGTQRVKYDAVYEEEEEREKSPPPSPAPSFYEDEEYVRKLFALVCERQQQQTRGKRQGEGVLDEQSVSALGQELGMEWDLSFARDLTWVVGVEDTGVMGWPEFWGWYKVWSRQKVEPKSFALKVEKGFTEAIPTHVIRRNKAKVRLDHASMLMRDQIQTAIRKASLYVPNSRMSLYEYHK